MGGVGLRSGNGSIGLTEVFGESPDSSPCVVFGCDVWPLVFGVGWSPVLPLWSVLGGTLDLLVERVIGGVFLACLCLYPFPFAGSLL